MIKEKIEKLRNKLEKMIELNFEFEEIYKISVKLDRLIVEYYRNSEKITSHFEDEITWFK